MFISNTCAQVPLKIDQPRKNISNQFISSEPIETTSVTTEEADKTTTVSKPEAVEDLVEDDELTLPYVSIKEPKKRSTPELTTEQKLELYGDKLFGKYAEPFEPLSTEEQKTQLKRLIEEAGVQAPGKKILSKQEDKDTGIAYLSDYLDPWKEVSNDQKIDLAFENTDLKQFIEYLSNLFKVTFITDGDFDPIAKNGKKIEGNKITFRSHTPLSKEQVWEIGLTFLEIAGFSVVPEPTLERGYRITSSSPTANQEPLPTFIGVDPEILPNNDSKIRYVYFASNADLKTIGNIINEMVSPSAGKPIIFNELRAILLTDRSSNIKSIMSIVKELDSTTRPEVLSVIRLQRAESVKVAELFNKELLGQEDRKTPFTFGPIPKKAPTTRYFSDKIRIIAEPRTNSLVILGPQGAVSRVEEFITRHIDREIDLPYSPLHVYRVRHLNAVAVGEVLNNLVKFGDETLAGQAGGIRNFDQYFRNTVQIFPEPSSNSLVIKADYEDFLKLKNTILRLDVEQPQVALKVLILNVDLVSIKELGTQLRNKIDECNQGIFENINFQNSLTGPFIERDSNATPLPNGGATRLLGNLVRLASGQPLGSTLVSFGEDLYGVWGLLRVLETHSRTSVIAKPYLITTHKYPASVTVGETRRVISGTVSSVSTVTGFEDESANLTVEITPIISYDNMITLNVYVSLANFTNTDNTGVNAGNKTTRHVQTSALVADSEVLALGGLTQDREVELLQKVPILGDIPLIGTFFKFKRKTRNQQNLLILVLPQIIRPNEDREVNLYTTNQVNKAKETIYEGQDATEARDPVYKWFFKDYLDKEAATIDKFVSRQSRYLDETKKPSKQIPLALNENNTDSNSKNTTRKSLLELIPSKKSEIIT